MKKITIMRSHTYVIAMIIEDHSEYYWCKVRKIRSIAINNRLIRTDNTFHSLVKFLNFKMFGRITGNGSYAAIIRPNLMCGHERLQPAKINGNRGLSKTKYEEKSADQYLT